METRAEAVDFVLTKLGLDKENNTIVDHAHKAAYQIYCQIWDSYPFNTTKKTVVISSAEKVTRLPHYIQEILAASYDNTSQFRINEQEQVLTLNPESFDSTSSRSGVHECMRLSPDVGVYISPNSGQISVNSTSGSDSSIISIVGVFNGEDVVEEITLNGVVPVSSVNSYDEIYTASKAKTAGTVYIKDSIGTTIQTLLPHEHSRTHQRIQLVDAPQTNDKALVLLVKMRPIGYVNDNDSPMLDGIDGAIKKALEAEMLEFDEQYEKARSALSSANSMFSSKITLEEKQQQRNFEVNVVPEILTTGYTSRNKRFF